MKSTYLKFSLPFLLSFFFVSLYSQNVGIGQSAPLSKLDVNGGLAIGAAYSGSNSAPANGAIIQGDVGVGTAAPMHKLHVMGDVRIEGDFINQEMVRSHQTAVQSVPYTNLAFTPLNGTTVSITPEGNGVTHSGVLVTGFARVFGGSLNGANSSLGGYFMVLERDTDPAFPAPTIMTYTSGACYIKTPNGLGSAAIGYGGGGAISYVDLNLTGGTTYYYRLTLVPNSVGVNTGTFDVYQRDLNIVQLKR